MRNLVKIQNITILILFALFLLQSCIPGKDVRYLQGEIPTSKNLKAAEYKVQPGDFLYIKLYSLNQSINQFLYPSGTSVQNTAVDRYRDLYLVDDSGFVEFPFSGKVLAKDKTTKEIKRVVESTLSLKETTVTVTLGEICLTILGEVKIPGRYQFLKEKMNVFELIGMAGDLTEYANRRNAKIIRETIEGRKIINIDLTQTNIINNEFYYLQPNDIVYIEPLKATFFDQKRFPFFTTLALSLTTFSSLILLINYFK